MAANVKQGSDVCVMRWKRWTRDGETWIVVWADWMIYLRPNYDISLIATWTINKQTNRAV